MSTAVTMPMREDSLLIPAAVPYTSALLPELG